MGALFPCHFNDSLTLVFFFFPPSHCHIKDVQVFTQSETSIHNEYITACCCFQDNNNHCTHPFLPSSSLFSLKDSLQSECQIIIIPSSCLLSLTGVKMQTT